MPGEEAAVRKRGNPNWGQPVNHRVAVVPSAWEKFIAHIGLTKADEATLAQRADVRRWALKHVRKHYIPEPLLEAMGIAVEMDWD